MPKPPEIKDISRAAARGVKAENNTITVEAGSVTGPEFTAAMGKFSTELEALLLSATESLGLEPMVSIALSVTVAMMRGGYSAHETAFVLRQFADQQMAYYNEGAANG